MIASLTRDREQGNNPPGGMVLPQRERLPLGELKHPRVEPEIAFLLGDEPEYPATVTGVPAATEAVFAAIEVIEVIDSRYRDSGGLTAPVSMVSKSVVSAEFDGLGSVEVYC